MTYPQPTAFSFVREGSKDFFGFLGTVMAAHLAFATVLAGAPRQDGTLGRMRLFPIAQRPRDKIAG